MKKFKQVNVQITFSLAVESSDDVSHIFDIVNKQMRSPLIELAARNNMCASDHLVRVWTNSAMNEEDEDE